MRSSAGWLVALVLSGGLTGCTTDEVSQVPDASVQYCLKEGFKPVAVLRDGIPDKYLCINESTGKKCESWAFLRQECHLRGAK